MTDSSKGSTRLQTLVELATQKCIQNIYKLNDVGSTPFHLLSPVLERMNAKQLSTIETCSPHLIPLSDTLWPNLIEKDFPDRPIYSKRRPVPIRPSIRHTKGDLFDERMPNRSLYYQYSQERDAFRNDSAKRLRRITERLKQEKEAKAIVAVPTLLRDPTVNSRKRMYNGTSVGRNTSSYQSNTIIGKARRELKNRSIMFQGKNQNRYDAYAAFKQQPQSSSPVERRLSRKPTSFNTAETRRQVLLHRPTVEDVKRKEVESLFTSPSEILPNQSDGATFEDSTTSVETASSETILPPRKRRPPPSIFLSRKRPQSKSSPVKSRPKGSTSSTDSTASKVTTEVSEPSKIQAIRSSIFS
ncbi:hypothetical protein CLIB1423_31S00232 [[Candida] railenensis]|uniref:Elongin-A n=1 Tax=[Candida] railenensis TaxID=45579 RepID=A0A9P0W139_9ASCO|nr:hypothetical protein CLIB1423_31S00232 [[Candida] railenensis]